MQTTRLSPEQTETQTDGQMDRQTDMTENITYPHTRVEKLKRALKAQFWGLKTCGQGAGTGPGPPPHGSAPASSAM